MPPADDSSTALNAEMDALAARAGLVIQPDRRAGILAVYTEVRAMTTLIRALDLKPEDEPANTYTFDPITRSA